MKKFFILFILIVTSIHTLLAADPIAVKYYQTAVSYHKRNDFKNAITYYNVAINKDKKYWQAWLGLGMCYYNLKKYQEAHRIFKYVLMLKPGEPTATKYYNMLAGITTDKKSRTEQKNFTKKTKMDIMWRSALFPGFGQFYNQEYVKAYAYSIAFLASIAGIVKFTLDQREAVSSYENTNYDFENKFKEAEAATIRVYIPIGIATAIWSLSILDGYLTGADEKTTNIKVGVNRNNTVSISINKNF